MTIAGCDYAWSHPSVTSLQAAGISFVCRYLSTDPTKNITAAEAASLHAAGINVVVNWETTGTTYTGGYQAGLADAKAARSQATAIGVPSTVPIYYSIDANVPADQLATVLDYLHGCSDAEGSKALVGVYGSYSVVLAAAGAGYIYLWQTYAWSNGLWAQSAQLRQVNNDQSIGGASVDLDEAVEDAYGQWSASGSPSAPAPGSGRPEVSQGATGAWVETLQRSLMLAGQNPQGVDGDFGANTLEAVRAFQGAYHLAVDGVCGPQTWGALAVRTGTIQAALDGAGAKLTIDDTAGPLTASAVTAYQSSHGLTVDGIVGPLTSHALGIPT